MTKWEFSQIQHEMLLSTSKFAEINVQKASIALYSVSQKIPLPLGDLAFFIFSQTVQNFDFLHTYCTFLSTLN